MAQAKDTVIGNVYDQKAIAESLREHIKDVLTDETDEGAEELMDVAIEGETDLKGAISSAVARINHCDDFVETLDARIKRLTARRDRFKHQSKQIRTAIQVALEAIEMKKLELAEATVSLSKAAPKLGDVDESLIPSQFFKSEPKLDRAGLLRALKDAPDDPIPGAALAPPAYKINIRGV